MNLTDHLFETASGAIVDIGIRVEEKDLRHLLMAITRLESNVRTQANEVPRLYAIDYYHQVVGNIMTQAKMAGYPNYHPRYAAWKEQRSSGGFWRLAGDLIRAMTYNRTGSTRQEFSWFAGVPVGVLDSGGKSWLGNTPRGKRKEIAWYGRIMEEGYHSTVQDHPARPIFGPTLNDYASSEAPVQRGEQALRTASREWR